MLSFKLNLPSEDRITNGSNAIIFTDMTAKKDEYIICRMRLEGKRT